MPVKTKDVRIESLRPLIPPAILLEEIPLEESAVSAVARSREAVAKVLHGKDGRLLVIAGPCSIHDPAAALEYAERLMRLATSVEDDLFVVMRAYFEKPRTTVGWKGLINDPNLDGSFAINDGLRTARKLLRDIVRMGMPVACEFLDPISPQFTADLVSWGAIGARTTESQVHRELASGLSMPVGFKNGTDGNIRIAVEGVVSAMHPHRFLGVTEQGLAAIVSTRGNPDCHIILRGGDTGPNYGRDAIIAAKNTLVRAKLPPRLMVDISHGNSGKDHRNQPMVAQALAEQMVAGEDAIFGVMMESFLVEGSQALTAKSSLRYGQSITDACMGWETTAQLIKELALSSASNRSAPARS
jgi:3-deoxy-7-phosphoheptulonate synthase